MTCTDVAFPALVFTSMLRIIEPQVLADSWYLPLLGVVMLLLGIGIGWLAVPLLGISDHPRRGSAALAAGKPDLAALRNLLLNPGLVATIAGIGVALAFPWARTLEELDVAEVGAGEALASVVVQALAFVGDTTVPLAMLVTGSFLAGAGVRGTSNPQVLGVSAMRLLALPAIALLLLYLAPMAGLQVETAIGTTLVIIPAAPVAVTRLHSRPEANTVGACKFKGFILLCAARHDRACYRWVALPLLVAMLSGCVAANSTSTSNDATAGIPAVAAEADPHMDALERELRKLLTDSGSSVERVRGDIMLRIAGPGVFEPDRADIGPAFQELLGALASLLSTDGSTLIEVTGFTDATGPMIVNLALSLERAERVAQMLASHGTPKQRIVAKGLGPLHPIADNDTPEGRQLNRRVELTIGRLPREQLAAVTAP